MPDANCWECKRFEPSSTTLEPTRGRCIFESIEYGFMRLGWYEGVKAPACEHFINAQLWG